MNGAEFVDTNVLVYAYDHNDLRKQRIARDLLRGATIGKLAISTQVLAEFAATLLHKVSPATTADAVLRGLDALSAIRLVVPDADLVRRAIEARTSYGLHFYDGMILAAAERAGCERIWSEDFNTGQEYFGVTVKNPFQ